MDYTKDSSQKQGLMYGYTAATVGYKKPPNKEQYTKTDTMSESSTDISESMTERYRKIYEEEKNKIDNLQKKTASNDEQQISENVYDDIELKAKESKYCHSLLDKYFKSLKNSKELQPECSFPWNIVDNITVRQKEFLERSFVFLGTRLIQGFKIYDTEFKFEQNSNDVADIIFVRKWFTNEGEEVHLYEVVDWKMMGYRKASLKLHLQVKLYMWLLMQKVAKQNKDPNVKILVIGGYFYTESGIFIRVSYSDHVYNSVDGKYYPTDLEVLKTQNQIFFDLANYNADTKFKDQLFADSIKDAIPNSVQRLNWDLWMADSDLVFPFALPTKSPILSSTCKYPDSTILELIMNVCYRLHRVNIAPVIKKGLDITSLPEVLSWIVWVSKKVNSSNQSASGNWENVKYYVALYFSESKVNPRLTLFYNHIKDWYGINNKSSEYLVETYERVNKLYPRHNLNKQQQ